MIVIGAGPASVVVEINHEMAIEDWKRGGVS